MNSINILDNISDGKIYDIGTELYMVWDVKDIIVVRKNENEKN